MGWVGAPVSPVTDVPALYMLHGQGNQAAPLPQLDPFPFGLGPAGVQAPSQAWLTSLKTRAWLVPEMVKVGAVASSSPLKTPRLEILHLSLPLVPDPGEVLLSTARLLRSLEARVASPCPGTFCPCLDCS